MPCEPGNVLRRRLDLTSVIFRQQRFEISYVFKGLPTIDSNSARSRVSGLAWCRYDRSLPIPTSLAQPGKNRLPIGNFAWLNALARRSQRQTLSDAHIPPIGAARREVHAVARLENGVRPGSVKVAQYKIVTRRRIERDECAERVLFHRGPPIRSPTGFSACLGLPADSCQ
jgi:hypothetical protein